ncbi:hypothetical protein ONE63_000947 [Megalurothrips usitatus]|uniref:Uncharacterized protein n=1 Tax=Megalurothrips usitatus TaxID=439358 RepID=A0AAV7Y513_9NEOP|nr:hypothetical protein ONE63_000947 [Megalurothrips usitatus]
MAPPSPEKCHPTSPTLSQCSPLCEVGGQDLTYCHAGEDATTDFKSLLDDDIVSQSQISNNDNSFDFDLGSSIVDTSINSCSSRDSGVQPVNRPFVPSSVEEISLVASLDRWSNCNVRVIGKVSPIANSDYWTLVSIGEEGGPFSVAVDMGLISRYPSPDLQVQVFGEIHMCESNPVIQAKFFRDFSSVDIFFYNKGLEVVKKYAPHFIGEKRRVQPSVDTEQLNTMLQHSLNF